MRLSFLHVIIVSLSPWLCMCGGPDPASQESSTYFLVAASMTDAANDLAKTYQDRDSDCAIVVIPGPSNALAQQILQGTPADVFVSANPNWIDTIEEAELARRTAPLAGNDLVLIVSAGNPASIHTPSDLTPEKLERLAIAGEAVPAGAYAEQALRALGLFQPLSDAGRIARGGNVRITLSYVERGEAEAGIVYATDSAISSKVEVVHRFDPEGFDPIVYPVALLSQKPCAEAFYDFLLSEEATRILTEYRFSPVDRTVN